ncbi:MAG: hypothetical protein KF892_23760 [Rhizobacter sp.]|nr:hypothetical protein [Rhizobacter sp.]
MIFLQATQIARDALGIGKEPLDEAGETQSLLGNWLVNVVPIGDRHAFLFMSARSMLSFPIMIGQQKPGLKDMPTFLAYGVKQIAQHMKLPAEKVSRLLKDFDEVAVCKTSNQSQLGALRAVAADYAHHARGSSKVDPGRLITSVNSLPRKGFEFSSAFEITHELFLASDA